MNETIETKVEHRTRSVYEVVSSFSLTFLIILLPIFIAPNSHISFVFAKTGLILFFVIIASVSLILHIMNERKIGIPSALFLYPMLLLPFSYFLSSLFSKDVAGSLIGSGSDIETFFFISLCTLLMVLIARFFGGKQKIFIVSLGFILVSVIVTGYLLLRYIFGANFLSFGVFSKITSNTIGSFNDIGIIAGLAVILSLLSLDFLSLGKKTKIGLYISLVLSLVIACISNFYLTQNLFGINVPITLSSVLAFFALIIFVHKKVSNPKSTFPYVTLVVFLITLICTVQSQNITFLLQNKIGISQVEILDVRISPVDTLKIAGQSYKGGGVKTTLLGIGPNQFYTAWALYKPNTVNSTIFWNKDFDLGFSYVLTSAVTVGVLGSLAWFLLALLVLYSVYRLFKLILSSNKDQLVIYSSLVASVGTLYLWLMVIVYTPGVVVLPFAFIFTGMLGSILVKEQIITIKYISWEKAGYWRSFFIVFSLVIAITVLIGTGYSWSNRLVASIYADKASASLQGDTPDVAKAQEYITKSLSFNSSHIYLRAYSDIALIRPYQLISKSGGQVTQADVTKEVASDAAKSISAAEYSAFGKTRSSDYQDWIQLGRVYEMSSFLGATTTVSLAAQAYVQASTLNPKNPIPLYLLGRLLMYAQQKDAAVEQLKNSLTLKPDFADSIKLLDSINNNNSTSVDLKSSEDRVNQVKATSTQKIVIPKNKK